MLNGADIPEEIICARLMCLNKCPDQNGKLENIRPIAITGTLIKILEKVTLNRMQLFEKMHNIHNHKSQIGFLKGMGCDVNIMRLRQRTQDALDSRDIKDLKKEKYILFIDFKAAYDSVNHKRLFDKLSKKGYPINIVNTIKKIYSSACMRLNMMHDPINVNRGVLQGGILSPFLFNCYIDDLIISLNNKCFEVLAYADDIALICTNEEQLQQAMNILDEWSKDNFFEINKKKSGILIIDQERGGRKEINGYPIKQNYKYLGIILNSTLNPIGSLKLTDKRLDKYISRNRWLIKKYFTPKSLVTISLYYQYSRIGYGMNCFLDMPDVNKEIEKYSMKYTKSILGLSNHVSSDKVRLTLNRPEESKSLWVLLRKNINKYIEHYGEKPILYNKINWKNEKWLKDGKFFENHIDLNNMEHFLVKKTIAEASKIEMARRNNIIFGKYYNHYFKKRYYRYPNYKDFRLIRYLCNSGFYKEKLFPKCKLCDSDNSRKHVTNECETFNKLREETIKKLSKKLEIKDKNIDLEQLILRLYYDPRETDHKRYT